MQKKIQDWLCKYSFELFILFHFIAFSITFLFFPCFETFVVVFNWITLTIFFHRFSILELPIVSVTIFILFILKIKHADFTHTEVNKDFVIILITVAAGTLRFFSVSKSTVSLSPGVSK